MIVILAAGVLGAPAAWASITLAAGETWTMGANEIFDINGSLTIPATATFDASASTTAMTVTDDWTNNGVFSAGDGTVTFTTAGNTSTLIGATTFYNFTCIIPSKPFVFEAGVTQTIANTLTLSGQALGTEIMLRSSLAGTRFTFDVTGDSQVVDYVDVKDSNSSTNNITAEFSINAGNNDDLEPEPHWIFSGSIYILSPGSAATYTVGQTSTIIGKTVDPGEVYQVLGTSGGVEIVVATGTSDATGTYYFRVVVDSATLLDIGANSVRGKVVSTGSLGPPVPILVSAAPTTDEVPTIVSPIEDEAIRTNPFIVSGLSIANTTVTLQALDVDSELVINCGSTTSDADGVYSLSSDAVASALAAGANILTVTTEITADSMITTSAFRNVKFSNPFGIVFDSINDSAINADIVSLYYDNDPGPDRNWILAVPGTQIDIDDANPQTVGTDGFYSYFCINGDFYVSNSAYGYEYPTKLTDAELPAGRAIITPGSRGEPFTITGVVLNMDQPMDPLPVLLKIVKTVNKKEASVGDIVTYTITMENVSTGDVTNVFIEDKIPAGFKYLNGKVILDNQGIANPTGNRPLTFTIGTVPLAAMRTLKYQLVIGSGVQFGKYDNTAFAKYINGTVISNYAIETVRVVPDPLFDLGTVIGKVFHDANENGFQDEGEGLIGNARIVMEDGTVITADKYGKYHLQAIIPARHMFRLDERTLPAGAYLTTEKAVVENITPGILVKVNFGVALPEGTAVGDRPFMVTKDDSLPRPRLSTAMYNDMVTMYEDGRLGEDAEFRIFTNYPGFINSWKLEIFDADTLRVVRTYRGTRADIFAPIVWDGGLDEGASGGADGSLLLAHGDKQSTANGQQPTAKLQPGRKYAYRAVVTGAGGKRDETEGVPLDIAFKKGTRAEAVARGEVEADA